ncbi:MAG: HRDC domain-containing protein, partial [Kofleriaceae bacterium]|nr:HRDC domain-containing protein [Kofleriaceae bacterium]
MFLAAADFGLRGAFRELVAWRRRLSVDRNLPPSWLMVDKAMLGAARQRCGNIAQLRKIKGIGDGTISRYAEEILD